MPVGFVETPVEGDWARRASRREARPTGAIGFRHGLLRFQAAAECSETQQSADGANAVAGGERVDCWQRHIDGVNMICAFGVPGFISHGELPEGRALIPVVCVVA